MQHLFADVYRFKPNRATGGGSSYLITRPEGNVLIDAPAWSEEHNQALQALGGVTHWFFTHRGGIGEVERWFKVMQPQILIHEQEAFLVNAPVAFRFAQDCEIAGLALVWTPGHSPGSTCLRWRDTLFSGRHILPNSQGQPRPLKLAKTFHWPRQLKSVQKLVVGPEFTRICPGAAVGLLRGAVAIEDAQAQLKQFIESPKALPVTN